MKQSIPAIVLAGLLMSVAALADPVNINTADARTLAKELNGIGLSRGPGDCRLPREERAFEECGRTCQGEGYRDEGRGADRPNIRVKGGEGQGSGREAVGKTCSERVS